MKNLARLFVFVLSIGLLTSCIPESLNEEKVYPEIMIVESDKYNSFVDSYNQYYSKLSESDKAIINEYIAQKESASKEASNGRTAETTCTCQSGQTTCSASTWFSSCCICCSIGEVTACGTYGPVASCQCKESPSLGGRSSQSQSPEGVTIYPSRFNELFQFSKSKSISVSFIVAEFDKLIFE